MAIELSERAVEEVKKVMEEQSLPAEEYGLRVAVQGGGCSGFSYKLGFGPKSDVTDTDIVLNQHGVDVYVEKKFLPYLEGTKIDFYEGLEKRGFTFDNPMATRGCGCGSSFSVKGETPAQNSPCQGCPSQGGQ